MTTDNTSSGLTLTQWRRALRSRLSPRFGEREAQAIISLIFLNLKGWNTAAMLAHDDTVISPFTASKINEIVERLERDEPIQYILGEAYFYGMTLRVTPDVLIPRPETAELVDIIADRYSARRDLDVLDVGTGSGCIAIALAATLPFSRVTGIDISPKAVDVARGNARAQKRDVTFLTADIFQWAPQPESLDIIVSNPPYICDNEKAAMEDNVLLHEPHTALFVPDSDPLRFYTRIAAVAADALRPGGELFFELNPLYADRLASEMEADGWQDVEVINDSHGKRRFLAGRKREEV